MPAVSVKSSDVPVTLPSGRARLRANPAVIGSEAPDITIGMLVVARRAAAVVGVPIARMTSTQRCTNSWAKAARRSSFRSANRGISVML